jgi:SAM-dependent methyltransferase
MSEPDISSIPAIYDAMAENFEEHASQNLYNAYYDRPAVLSLLPSVEGQRVLDIGCGPGLYVEWLIEHGARVVGIDISREMVERARQRVKDGALFYQHDIAQPLTFARDASFDIAIAPLMIHYVTDRVSMLQEVARVLTIDGCLVLSTQHPFADWQRHGGSYFATELVEDTWRREQRNFQMPFWRVSLTTLCDEFSQAGFYIDRLLEPQPVPEGEKIDPEDYRKMMGQPGFIVFRLCKHHVLNHLH